MIDKPLPAFRPIGAPLDVDDAALDAVNARLGVPVLARTEPRPAIAQSPPAAALPVFTAQPAAVPVEKLSVMVPDYLGAAIRLKAAETRTTVRYVVMEALAAHGFTIAAADMVPDGRRKGPRP